MRSDNAVNRACPLRLPFLLAIVFVSNAVAQAPALQDAGKESKFKAAYICNFLQFIEWPDSAFTNRTSPVTIGILNDDSFAKILEQLVRGDRINGREIVVRELHEIRHIKECQVLFIPKNEAHNIDLILSSADGSSVLTVGEFEGFAEDGGAINFFFQDSKLRFEINPDVLKKTNLNASSRLLRLARIVGSTGGGR